MPADAIADLLSEGRTFPPPPSFTDGALVTDRSLHAEAEQDRLAFWARQAEALDWHRPWDTVLEWEPPFARWFVGGQLNVSVNCLDRHVDAGHGDQVAYHWEGEPGDTRTLTYADLLDEVQRAANGLRELGVSKGDRVAVYLPMIPELAVTMLACARIGAVHS
ncbi:MAG: acetyl-coenzyme A synthetase N-terminal domain-containing protein, partial [Nitriliruptoraceae bacterium]